MAKSLAMSPTIGDGVPPLCPRGGHWSQGGNSTPPYRAGTVGQPDFYKSCHTRGDYVKWTWHATDPPCRTATEEDSWCEALRGRSLLFVSDSLSLQMFWSLLHLAHDLAPADDGEIGRARRLYDMGMDMDMDMDMDLKRGGEFRLCNGTSRAAFVRNDWLVENKWNRSCQFDAANNFMCRSFAKLAASYNTLVLNTGLHMKMRQEAGVIAAHTTLLARWLNTTRHDLPHKRAQSRNVPRGARTAAESLRGTGWAQVPLGRRRGPQRGAQIALRGATARTRSLHRCCDHRQLQSRQAHGPGSVWRRQRRLSSLLLARPARCVQPGLSAYCASRTRRQGSSQHLHCVPGIIF